MWGTWEFGLRDFIKKDNQDIILVLNTRFDLFPAYELIPTVICEWSFKYWNAFAWTIERNSEKLYEVFSNEWLKLIYKVKDLAQ